MSPLGAGRGPEQSLDDELTDLLGGDPALLETARRVRATTQHQALDPLFKGRLRAQLMQEATVVLAPKQGWFRARGGIFAWGGLALGTGLIAATAVLLFVVPFHPAPATPQAQLVMATNTGNVDPNTAITVAFNVPMNESAVDAGISIEPATAYTTSWHGNDLVISPTHPLANDTPYTVTIARSAAVSSTGTAAQTPIQLTFGTAPSPVPSPTPTSSPLATLSPVPLGPVSSASPIAVSPSGSVVVDSPGAPSASPSPTATVGPSPSASPSATAQGASPSATPAAASEAVTEALTASGSTILGPASTSVAYSPDMNSLALAVPTAAGGSTVEVERADGSGISQTLYAASQPVICLAWSDSSTVVVVTADNVMAVPLSGQPQQLAAVSGSGSFVAVSSTGRFVIENGISGGQGLSVLDLASNTSVSLPGSTGPVALSADGTTVSWLDTSGTAAMIDVAPADNLASTTQLPLPSGVSSVAQVALNGSGSEVALIDSAGNLELLNASSGAELATLLGPVDAVVFDANTNHLALITGSATELTAALARVPTVASGTQAQLPGNSSAALNQFVEAQVNANTSQLTALSGGSVDAVQLTPTHLSRGYVIATSVGTTGDASPTVTATARLILDASGNNSVPMTTEETVVLTATGGGDYQVTQLTVPALAAESMGPHVIHVDMRRNLSALDITFDSDLDASTLAPAITVVDVGGQPVLVTVHYDPVTRTATLTLPANVNLPVTVTVSTALHDIDNNALAAPYSLTVGG